MKVDTAKGLQNLRELLSECETLYDVLSYFTACENTDEIIDELNCNDVLWAMAEQNDMDSSLMGAWVKDHIENSVECRVFQESGPAGGWHVVSIKCMDKVFYLDWVLD